MSNKLKWDTFRQNNSGGDFVVNADVADTVCIQASRAEEAIEKAETFMDNSDSCPCCGDRWDFWVYNDEGDATPSCYGEPIALSESTPYHKEARLHWADGRVTTMLYGERKLFYGESK